MKTLALETRFASARQLVPGLLVAALVAMAAAFLGSHYKGSMLLFALLLGLALHFVSEDPRCAAGIQFASSTVLRLGVALLGLRLTIANVGALGWQTVLALFGSVFLTIAFGLLLARMLKIERSTDWMVSPRMPTIEPASRAAEATVSNTTVRRTPRRMSALRSTNWIVSSSALRMPNVSARIAPGVVNGRRSPNQSKRCRPITPLRPNATGRPNTAP